MAEPIIIVKENPGTLRIEVKDSEGNIVKGFTCPTVRFDANSELTVDGEGKGANRYKPKRNTPHGTCIEIKIGNPEGS